MGCIYEHNAFCNSLPPDIREQLCMHCKTRHLGKNYRFHMSDLNHSFAVLVNGVMLTGTPAPSDVTKLLTNGIASPGMLISIGDIFSSSINPDAREILCLVDSDLALIDYPVIHRFFDTSIEFNHAILKNILNYCVANKNELVTDTFLKDAYSAVRYAIKYARDHHVESLTHEQLSLICNLRRPTVTRILHTLLQNEPELFTVPLPDA